MATQSEKEMAENIDQLRADIANLSKTVKSLISDTSGIQSTLKKTLDETAQRATRTGEKILKDAGDMGSEALHAAAKQATHTIDDIEIKITRNPFAAVAVALGIGFMFGLLNRR